MDFSRPSYRLGFAFAVVIIAVLGYFFFMKTEVKRDEAAKEVQTEKVVSAPKGAVLKTSLGEIEILFFAEKAPKTVANFEKLAASGFYDGTKFHRVIKDFMIQGGDPLSKDDAEMGRWGMGGPGYQFADEFNSEKLVRGVLAMANSGTNTNGSQFFIVTASATPWLDGKHAGFGRVVRGMNVVDKIENTPTGERDLPKTPIVIESIVLK